MPPPLHLSKDVLDTKAWASETIDSMFSDSPLIGFEPYKPRTYSQCADSPSPSPPQLKRNLVRRSLSLLERGIFSGHRYSLDDCPKGGPPIPPPHLCLPDLSDQEGGSSESSDSSPASSPHASISTRFKRNLSFNRPNINRMSQSFTFGRLSVSYREREGLSIWKSAFEMSLRSGVDDPDKSPLSVRAAQLRRFILTELTVTEQTYLDHLRTMRQVYMEPLLEAANGRTQGLVSLRDVHTLFAFIPELHMLSSHLVRRLRSDDLGAGRVFCDMENDFEVFIYYAVNYRRMQRCLSRIMRSVVYQHLAQDSLSRQQTGRMELSDYMITPIQRITRYCLLLKDLKKYSAPSDPDYIYLDRALKNLSALASAMNDVQ